jgi:hypothetical protein
MKQMARRGRATIPSIPAPYLYDDIFLRSSGATHFLCASASLRWNPFIADNRLETQAAAILQP